MWRMKKSKVGCVTVEERKLYLLDVDLLVALSTLRNVPMIPPIPFRRKYRLVLIFESMLNSILTPRYLCS